RFEQFERRTFHQHLISLIIVSPDLTNTCGVLTMARHATSRAPAVARGGWTIPEWCVRWGKSRASWYTMPPEMRPRVTRAGPRSPRITPEADAEWARKNTQSC